MQTEGQTASMDVVGLIPTMCQAFLFPLFECKAGSQYQQRCDNTNFHKNDNLWVYYLRVEQLLKSNKNSSWLRSFTRSTKIPASSFSTTETRNTDFTEKSEMPLNDFSASPTRRQLMCLLAFIISHFNKNKMELFFIKVFLTTNEPTKSFFSN